MRLGVRRPPVVPTVPVGRLHSWQRLAVAHDLYALRSDIRRTLITCPTEVSAPPSCPSLWFLYTTMLLRRCRPRATQPRCSPRGLPLRHGRFFSTLRDFMPQATPVSPDAAAPEVLPPYISASDVQGDGRSVYVETYGCQMNVSDTEVVRAVLKEAGYGVASSVAAADVVLLNTCAIREKAEATIWNRLREIRAESRKAREAARTRGSTPPKVVGLLGCMGERLKGRLLENERLVDIVCGPDAYRSLPRLLASARAGQPSLDVALSLEETYADVAPVREGGDGVSAFVSIMRGCNNMCSYCIVPFTRGRERSRPASSIEREVAALAEEGYREVTLLGQNVNSYADSTDAAASAADGGALPLRLVDGFTSKVAPPLATVNFASLMDRLAAAHPEMRFRFTSPHPKDFPDDLLTVIRDRPNVCESLHIPAQSGSTAVLEAMRRGYTREAYLGLIDRVRELLPRATISSDFISGFCGETDHDHQQTISLLKEVRKRSTSRQRPRPHMWPNKSITPTPTITLTAIRTLKPTRCATTRPSCSPTRCARRRTRTGGSSTTCRPPSSRQGYAR